jgi:methionyl-tRNA synthetase
VGCEAFKLESELVDGRCPDHPNSPLEYLEEKNYFFRLSAYQDRLVHLYEERPDLVLPKFRANEARSFIEGGLRDFSISRAGETWGIPLPWDESQVAYVWADALVNYLSALTYARPGEDLRPMFWPDVHHVMAKDILRFHCVYWPAMLLSAGYEVPKQIFVHGYLLLEERKISKSVGNVISPLDLVDVYGPDAVRFWAIRSVSFGQDGSVSLDSIRERYERELGNELGNLLSRTTAMIARYRDGNLPAKGSGTLAGEIDGLGRAVVDRIDAWDLTGAVEEIWKVVRRLNAYVEERKPWELAKDEEQSGALDEVLYDLADALRNVAVALYAFVPRTSAAILEALGQAALDVAWQNLGSGKLGALTDIAAAPPLFPRLDAPAAA